MIPTGANSGSFVRGAPTPEGGAKYIYFLKNSAENSEMKEIFVLKSPTVNPPLLYIQK